MNLMDLFVKISVDDQASSQVETLAGKMKGGLATAAKVGGAAIVAAGAAAVAITKQAVENYGEYEQLVGGVETLFKQSADTVMGYAENAYKTAGLSANEYMNTVTSFSASLLQSLGGDTEAAAKYADMAITDMADNANKMGTSMESIQNAYQGFAKQNYTMLDNLKLGYGGTKQEMERLLEDATKLSGIEYDIDSLSDVYEAIHVIQDELGITGTTAKEASETISGSVSAMKSAWSNLVTGIADENANFDELVDNFVESATTVAGNILPRVEQALNGIGQLVEKLAPVIVDAIPNLVKNVLPSLVKAAVSIVRAFVDVLSDEESIDTIIDAAVDIVLILADAIAENIDKIIEAIVKIVTTIVEALTDPDTLLKLVEAAIKIAIAIAKGIVEAIPDILKALVNVVENILHAIGEWGVGLFEKGKEIVKSIAKGIADAAKEAVTWGHDLIDNFVQGIKDRIQKVVDAVKNVAQKVKDFLGFSEPKDGPLSNFHTYAPDMMKLFAEGVRDNTALITNQIDKSFDFGERTVGLSANGAGGYGYAGNEEQSINVDVTLRLDDGTVLQKFARKLRPYMNNEAALAGGMMV